jgi:pseudouridine-5'-phosphate glycosidase
LIRVSEEVGAALAARRPVVALESTIISHGLPRPRNLEVARELEELLRADGVVPATIGLPAGRPTVGLTGEEIELLATSDAVAKVGLREMPLASAAGRHAATTVAATAYLAHAAGVSVMATGAIGGVHRGASVSFDESSDLVALARTPIVVVCAGVKSILDVPATLERLETLGVSVVGYRTSAFPGFYVADSGEPLEWRVEGPDEVVAALSAVYSLALSGALLVANPVPLDEQLDPELHDRLVSGALDAAERDGVSGKAVTPYLLDHIYRESSGASLAANVAAVRNNVLVAGAIAHAWAESSR